MRAPCLMAVAVLSIAGMTGATTASVAAPLDGPASPERVTIAPVMVDDLGAVFATVESVHQVPARTRLAGTLEPLAVVEGDTVTAGQVLARVRDPKLPLQLAALDARLKSGEAQLRQPSDESRPSLFVGRRMGNHRRHVPGYGRGGPKDVSWLYSAAMLAADFADADILADDEERVMLDEGLLHRGPAATVGLVARRR